MKKGISLIILVISIVVLAIITSIIAVNVSNNNVIINAQDAVNNVKRSQVVEDLAYKINIARIQKEVSGEYLFTNSDLLTLLDTYGTFNNNNFYLATDADENGIVYNISLFEIYDVDLANFVLNEISVSNVMTISIAEGFDFSDYVIKYQIGNLEPLIYTVPVQLSVGDAVNIVLFDKNGRELSKYSVAVID